MVRVAVEPSRRPGKESRPRGRVIEIITARNRFVHGHLREEGGSTWLHPRNPRLPPTLVQTNLPAGSFVQAHVETPQTAQTPAQLHITRHWTNQSAEQPQAIITQILAEQNISPSFSDEAQAEARHLHAQGALHVAKGHVDLQSLPFLTIDGADARDFDDAICLEPAHKGKGCVLHVAIADVGAFVTAGSALDEEAYRKGTSVYLPERMLPMLPEALCGDLCSLRPEEARLALVCSLRLDEEGSLRGHTLREGIIRSRARLEYNQVQRFFDGEASLPQLPGLAEQLRQMRTLALLLREKRSARGMIALDLPEIRVYLKKPGSPAHIELSWGTEAMRLIEQFMLEANEAVAQAAAKSKLPILYRNHDAPPPESHQKLAHTLWNQGIELPPGSLETSQALQAFLVHVTTHPRRLWLQSCVLRSLAQACYREERSGHFALAAPYYTHFTSPIRRYPDLWLHRALKAQLHKRKAAPLPPLAGLTLSERERTAAEAETRVSRLHQVLYMEPHLGESFPACVQQVSQHGLRVQLENPPVEGWLNKEDLPGSGWRLDRNLGGWVAPKKRLLPGDQIVCRLIRASRMDQRLEFDWQEA